jgi:sulfonate transport system substrate-binding protein
MRARTVAAVVALAALVSACGATAASSSSPQVTLRVGATGWAQAQAALAVAGLDTTPYKVEWSVFSGGDKQLQALQAGALDVTETSEIPPIFAAAGGSPKFKVVAVQQANTLLQEVVVGPGSPITGIAQLKGRKVGYVQNTTAQYFLDKLLEQAGLHWSDITAAPLSPNDGVTALHSGAIDALASYGNSIITVHRGGGRTIDDGKDILSGNFPWEASADTIADPAKRQAAADLLARIGKAYAYIRDGHEQAFAQKTADATHESLSDALSQFHDGEAQRPSKLVPTSAAAIASQQAVADVFTDLKVLPHKVDTASFWTDQVNADLTKALG